MVKVSSNLTKCGIILFDLNYMGLLEEQSKHFPRYCNKFYSEVVNYIFWFIVVI